MPRQYSPEFRQRALRLLDTTMEASDISEFEAIKSVAGKVGISEESVRRWRRKAQIDAGERPDTTSAEHAEIRKLKREVAELRRANEILKSASAFFAAELAAPQVMVGLRNIALTCTACRRQASPKPAESPPSAPTAASPAHEPPNHQVTSVLVNNAGVLPSLVSERS